MEQSYVYDDYGYLYVIIMMVYDEHYWIIVTYCG